MLSIPTLFILQLEFTFTALQLLLFAIIRTQASWTKTLNPMAVAKGEFLMCRAFMPIGALYAGTLWLGNAAYLYLSVSFIQMLKVRALPPTYSPRMLRMMFPLGVLA